MVWTVLVVSFGGDNLLPGEPNRTISKAKAKWKRFSFLKKSNLSTDKQETQKKNHRTHIGKKNIEKVKIETIGKENIEDHRNHREK